MIRVAELSFSDKDLNDRWNEVQHDFWGDLKTETVRALKRLLESMMETEACGMLWILSGRTSDVSAAGRTSSETSPTKCQRNYRKHVPARLTTSMRRRAEQKRCGLSKGGDEYGRRLRVMPSGA